MGLSYQEELKNIKKNRIVLEKRENIEIQQNSKGKIQTKKTFTRERYLCQPQNKINPPSWQTKTTTNDEEFSKESKQKKCSLQDHLGKESSNTTFVFNDPGKQPTYLNKNIQHETEKVQEQEPSLCGIRKDKKSHKNNANKHIKKAKEPGETWAEHLAGNCDKEIAKEKFSLQHQCVSTSPVYCNDKEVLPRPRKRNVGSQVTARKDSCEQGAEGDSKSSLQMLGRTDDKDQNSKDITKKKYFKTVLPNATTSEQTVNCCYSFVQNAVCPFSQQLKGVICRHHNYRQSPPPHVNPEYTYCQDEYYFDCANCPAVCSSNCKAATAKCNFRRQTTDLETHNFCTPPKYRNANTQSKSKCKNMSNKTSASPDLKEFIESKKRECEQQRESSKKQMKHLGLNKAKEAFEERLFKAQKLHKILSESEAAELVKCFDHYIDEREKELTLNNTKNVDDHTSTTTTVNLPRNQQQHGEREKELKLNKPKNVDNHTSPRTTTTVNLRKNQQQTSDDYAHKLDEASLGSTQYSSKTLQMLKQMKIREYKPQKLFNKIKDNKQNLEKANDNKQTDKLKNYQQYLQIFTKKEDKGKEREKPATKESTECITNRAGTNSNETERTKNAEQVLKETFTEDPCQDLKLKASREERSLHTQADYLQMSKCPYNEDKATTSKASKSVKEGTTPPEENFNEQLKHHEKLKDFNSETRKELLRHQYYENTEHKKAYNMNTLQTSTLIDHYRITTKAREENVAYRTMTYDSDSKDARQTSRRDYANCAEFYEPEKSESPDRIQEQESEIFTQMCEEMLAQHSVDDQKESKFKDQHDYYNLKSPKGQNLRQHSVDDQKKSSFKEQQDHYILKSTKGQNLGQHSVDDQKKSSFKEQQYHYNLKTSNQPKQGENLLYENSKGRMLREVHVHEKEFRESQDPKRTTCQEMLTQQSVEDQKKSSFKEARYQYNTESPKKHKQEQHQQYENSRGRIMREVHEHKKECSESQDPKGAMCQETLAQHSVEYRKKSSFKEQQNHYNLKSPNETKQGQNSVDDQKKSSFKEQQAYYNFKSPKEPKQEQHLPYEVSRERIIREVHEYEKEFSESKDPKGAMCQEMLAQHSVEHQKKSSIKDQQDHYNLNSPKETNQGQNLMYENSRERIFREVHEHEKELCQSEGPKGNNNLSKDNNTKKKSKQEQYPYTEISRDSRFNEVRDVVHDEQTLQKQFKQQQYQNVNHLKATQSYTAGEQEQYLVQSQREQIFSEAKNHYDSVKVKDDYQRNQELYSRYESRVPRVFEKEQRFVNESSRDKSNVNEHGEYLLRSSTENELNEHGQHLFKSSRGNEVHEHEKGSDLKKSAVENQTCEQCQLMEYLITDGLRQTTLTDHRTPSECKQASGQISQSLKGKLLGELQKHYLFSMEGERNTKFDERLDIERAMEPTSTKFRDVNQGVVYDLPKQKSFTEPQDRYDYKSTQSSRARRFVGYQDDANDPKNSRYDRTIAKRPEQIPHRDIQNIREGICFELQYHYEKPRETTNKFAAEQHKTGNCFETARSRSNLSEINQLSQAKYENSKETVYHQQYGERKMLDKKAELSGRDKEAEAFERSKQLKEAKSRYDHCVAEFKATKLKEDLNKYGDEKKEDVLNYFQSSSRQKATAIESLKPIKLCEGMDSYDYKISGQYEAEKEEDVLDVLRYFESEKDVQEFIKHLTKDGLDPEQTNKLKQLSASQSPKVAQLSADKRQACLDKYSEEFKTEEIDKILQSLDLEWLTELETSLKCSTQKCWDEENSSEAKNWNDYKSTAKAGQDEMNALLQSRKRSLNKDCEVPRNNQTQDPPTGELVDKTFPQNSLQHELLPKLNQEPFNAPESCRKQNHKSCESLEMTQKDETEMLTGVADQNSIDQVTKQDQQHTDTFEQAKESCSKEKTFGDYKRMLEESHSLEHNVNHHRSSQTDNNFANELQDTKETKIKDEILPLAHKAKCVLNNLKTCLKIASQTDVVKDKCFSLATKAAEDLIDKLSSSKSLEVNQSQIKKENLAETDHHIANALETLTVQEDQFKDLETSPDSSDSKLKIAAKHEEHFLNSQQTSKKPLPAQDVLASNENPVAEITISNLKEKLESLKPQLSANTYFAEESQQLEIRLDANRCQAQEILQSKQASKEISGAKESLLPLNENYAPEISTLNLLDEFETQNPSKELSVANSIYFEQKSYQLATRQDQRYQESLTNLRTPSLGTANISGNNREDKSNAESYTSTVLVAATSRRSALYPHLMPLKGILKSSRSEAESNDLITCKTSSVVSGSEYGLEFSIPAQQGMIKNTEKKKEVPQISNETLKTKDNSSRCPITIQNNVKLNESHSSSSDQHHQPICCPDCQLETEMELENYVSNEYDSTIRAVQMPAFHQCPCMWNTYVEMMINYYNGKRRR